MIVIMLFAFLHKDKDDSTGMSAYDRVVGILHFTSEAIMLRVSFLHLSKNIIIISSMSKEVTRCLDLWACSVDATQLGDVGASPGAPAQRSCDVRSVAY